MAWLSWMCWTMVAVLSLASLVPADDCESSYRFFMLSTPLSWTDAREACHIQGGDLASIRTSAQNVARAWCNVTNGNNLCIRKDLQILRTTKKGKFQITLALLAHCL